MNETSVSTTQQTPLGRPTGTSRTQLTPIACFTGVSKSQHHEPMRRCCFNAEMHKRCSEHAGEYVHSHTQMSVAILALSHSFCGRLWHEMSPGLMQTSSVASKHTAVNTPYAAAEQHARSVASEPTGAIAVDLTEASNGDLWDAQSPSMSDPEKDAPATATNTSRGAAEQTDHRSNAYVRETIESAWTRASANARFVSRSSLQEKLEQEMHVPITLDFLFHHDPPQRMQKKSWPGALETVSRCVAAYHHAFGASEHDACLSIQNDICGWANRLRRDLPGNVDTTQFLTLLHQYIENRSFNMAVRTVINQSLGSLYFSVRPLGQRSDDRGRQAVADVLEQCLNVLQEDYASLQTTLRQFRR